MNKAEKLRSAGYTDQQITEFFESKRYKLLENGYQDDQVNDLLSSQGYVPKSPDPKDFYTKNSVGMRMPAFSGENARPSGLSTYSRRPGQTSGSLTPVNARPLDVLTNMRQQEQKAALNALPMGLAMGLAPFTGGMSAIPAVGAEALAAASGEAARQLGTRAAGLPGAPQSGLEAAKQIGLQGLIGGASEGLGRLGQVGVSRALRAMGNVATPEERAAIRELQMQGVPINMGRRSGGLGMMIDQATDQTFTGPLVKNSKAKIIQEFLQRDTEDIVSAMGINPTGQKHYEISNQIKTALEANKSNIYANWNKMIDAFPSKESWNMDMTRSIIGNTRSKSDQWMRDAGLIKKELGFMSKKAKAKLQKTIGIIHNIAENKPVYPEDIKHLSSTSWMGFEALTKEKANLRQAFKDAVLKDMDAVFVQNPNIVGKDVSATELRDVANKSFIAFNKWLDEIPEAKTILGASGKDSTSRGYVVSQAITKKEDPTVINEIRQKVLESPEGGPEAWDAFRFSWLEKLVSDSITEDAKGVIPQLNPAKLAKSINKNEKLIKLLFPDESGRILNDGMKWGILANEPLAYKSTKSPLLTIGSGAAGLFGDGGDVVGKIAVTEGASAAIAAAMMGKSRVARALQYIIRPEFAGRSTKYVIRPGAYVGMDQATR